MAKRKVKAPKKRKMKFSKKHSWKNFGIPAEVEITDGVCPCTECGHKEMEQCDRKKPCDCCSGSCT